MKPKWPKQLHSNRCSGNSARVSGLSEARSKPACVALFLTAQVECALELLLTDVLAWVPTLCLQSMAKVSSNVHGLAQSARSVHMSPARSRPVGVGCGCHRG